MWNYFKAGGDVVVFFYFCNNEYFVKRSITICAILVEAIM